MQDLAAAYTDPRAGVSTTVDVQQVRIAADRDADRRYDPADLAESMALVGLMNPITVSADLTLIAGYHRLEAAKLLGWTQIDARILDLDPIRAEIAEIDENMSPGLTVWQQSKRMARRDELLHQLDLRRTDGRHPNPATVAGLEPKTTADLAAQAGISERTYRRRVSVGSRITPEVAAVIDDIDPESSSLPDSTRQLDYLAGVDDPQDQLDIVTRVADGSARDVFEASSQLKLERRKEAHTATVKASVEVQPIIEQADAIEWLNAIEPQSADLLITDPPYMTDVDDIYAFARSWLILALSKVKPTGRAYVCVGAYPEELLAYLTVTMGAKGKETLPAQVLVWTYRNTLGPNPAHKYKQNWQAVLYFCGAEAPPLNGDSLLEKLSVQEINAPDGRLGDRYHSWQKPLVLGERFVSQATQPGDVVIDPFAGTGSFLLAAGRLGRVAKGCDIDPEAIAVARERGCG